MNDTHPFTGDPPLGFDEVLVRSRDNNLRLCKFTDCIGQPGLIVASYNHYWPADGYSEAQLRMVIAALRGQDEGR